MICKYSLDISESIIYLFFGFCGQVATRCPSSLHMKHFIGPKTLFPMEPVAGDEGGGGGGGCIIAAGPILA